MRGTNIAKVEGWWPPINCLILFGSQNLDNSPEACVCFTYILPSPNSTSDHCDITKWCHDCLLYFSAGKALCMHRGNAIICLHICWHPHWTFTTTTATHEPYHLFHVPKFKPVTYILTTTPLTYFLTMGKLVAESHWWVASLANYNVQLYYRVGKTNIDADALLRVSWLGCMPDNSGTHLQVMAAAVQAM